MTKDSMEEINDKMSMDYQASKQYAMITNHGDINKLRAIFKGAFGLCDDTARERVNFLIASGIITVFGKNWKYNESGSTEFDKQIKLMQSIRDAGVPEEKPKDAFEQDLDKANRERYKAPQE